MRYLKQLIVGELKKIAKDKEMPRLGNVAGKLEKIDEEKIDSKNVMNLKEIAKELETLSKGTGALKTQKIKNIIRILEEKAKEMEVAKNDPLQDLIDNTIAQVSEKTGVHNFKPYTRDVMGYLIIKAFEVGGTAMAGKISASAAKIARYEGKAVDEIHIKLAIQLAKKRSGN